MNFMIIHVIGKPNFFFFMRRQVNASMTDSDQNINQRGNEYAWQNSPNRKSTRSTWNRRGYIALSTRRQRKVYCTLVPYQERILPIMQEKADLRDHECSILYDRFVNGQGPDNKKLSIKKRTTRKKYFHVKNRLPVCSVMQRRRDFL